MSDRMLVTGAGGFIGSHLVEALLRKGHQVRALVRYNSSNSWGWLDHLPVELKDGLEVVTGDIRDPHSVHTACIGVDHIFHLAALIGIPYSYLAPDSYIDTNIKGTLNVLQAARSLNIGRVLITSTSEVYGTAREVPITEEHPRQGQSPYSASKIGADHLALSYHLSFGTPITVVRPFNTYGPRQSARAVIPTIITQLLAGTQELKLGSLHPTRDLVHVSDTARGFMAIAQCPALIGQEVNIATGTEISVGDLAHLLMELTGQHASISSNDERTRPAASEVERLLGSAAKLRRLTDWEPTLDLNVGLAQTIAWFKEPSNRAGYKWQLYNV
jgi:NAD dependent epimerase/dehydratase